MLGDILGRRADVLSQMMSELREGQDGMLQTLRVCPWKAEEGGGSSSLQLLSWVLLEDILSPRTASEEQKQEQNVHP